MHLANKTLLILFLGIAGAFSSVAATNYVKSVEIDGQKMDGSYLDLASGDGKLLKIKSRKTLQLQTVQVTATMKIPHAIKYEKLKTLFVHSNYSCSADVFYRRFALYNLRAKRWLTLQRDELSSGVQKDEAKIVKFSDYIAKGTREVKVRIYLESTGDQPFVAAIDNFTFSGKAQPRISAHKQARTHSEIVKREPSTRVHQATGGSGNFDAQVEQLRGDFQKD